MELHKTPLRSRRKTAVVPVLADAGPWRLNSAARLDDRGLRRFVTFDPTSTLLRVSSTPTLALYGALDRNVDAADSATHLREYLTRAGNCDVTIKTYPNAGHQLVVSTSGYNGEPDLPKRFVPGYPQIMITWLTQRGFTKDRIV